MSGLQFLFVPLLPMSGERHTQIREHGAAKLRGVGLVEPGYGAIKIHDVRALRAFAAGATLAKGGGEGPYPLKPRQTNREK